MILKIELYPNQITTENKRKHFKNNNKLQFNNTNNNNNIITNHLKTILKNINKNILFKKCSKHQNTNI